MSYVGNKHVVVVERQLTPEPHTCQLPGRWWRWRLKIRRGDVVQCKGCDARFSYLGRYDVYSQSRWARTNVTPPKRFVTTRDRKTDE